MIEDARNPAEAADQCLEVFGVYGQSPALALAFVSGLRAWLLEPGVDPEFPVIENRDVQDAADRFFNRADKLVVATSGRDLVDRRRVIDRLAEIGAADDGCSAFMDALASIAEGVEPDEQDETACEAYGLLRALHRKSPLVHVRAGLEARAAAQAVNQSSR